MKKVYLNGFNNIALIIDDERKKYALTKEATARHIKNNVNTGFYRVKLSRLCEVLNSIKSAGYMRLKK